MQTTVADSGNASAITSTRQTAIDLDYLAARLHARRSRMAEAERLDGLCHIKNLPEFFRTIFPDSDLKEAVDFQHLLVHTLISEISGFRAYVPGPGVNLLDWMLVRFQMENLKVLFRACLTKIPIEELHGYLVSLPKELTLNTQRLASAESPEDFARLVPKGLLRENLEKALEIYRNYPRTFFFEAALDQVYFQGLISRMEKLPREDREIVRPIVYQEVDIFHLMLVVRGKFHYNMTPEMLRQFHIEGTLIRRALFAAMLNDLDLYTSVDRVAEHILNTAPSKHGSNDESMTVDAPVLEGLAWKQFFRLSNQAFRQSHMGLGAIIGFVGLRRVEVANLITISEGIRTGVAAEAIRGRLIPRTNVEGAYV
ncbi:MAG: V-type ATPase subunit [Proteobacteria bacterium]|nr:V-type ATPase subunit [Pseudomonadota bacterium]